MGMGFSGVGGGGAFFARGLRCFAGSDVAGLGALFFFDWGRGVGSVGVGAEAEGRWWRSLFWLVAASCACWAVRLSIMRCRSSMVQSSVRVGVVFGVSARRC